MRRTRTAKTTLWEGPVIVDHVVIAVSQAAVGQAAVGQAAVGQAAVGQGAGDQIVQIVGSLLVLAGFAAAQRGWLSPHSRMYLTVNLAGSATLAVQAALGAQWGFLLLEAVWALVSLVGLVSAVAHALRTRHTRCSTGAAADEGVRPGSPAGVVARTDRRRRGD